MKLILKQEAFEQCWAHSPLRAAARPFTRCRCRTPLAKLRIDVHDDNANDNNDNALQRGPLWPHRMGPTITITEPNLTKFLQGEQMVTADYSAEIKIAIRFETPT